jgi:hypothetical protein
VVIVKGSEEKLPSVTCDVISIAAEFIIKGSEKAPFSGV